ncbi:MAG: hypothetical protein ACT4PL_01955 [Phycisphaerales bacterium]
MAHELSQVLWLALTAHAPPTEDVQRWLDDEWTKWQSATAYEGCRAVWTTKWHLTRSLEEIAQLRKDVEGRPHHPGRVELANIDMQLRGELPGFEFDAYVSRLDAWRFNLKNDSGGFVDTVFTPAESWSMTPESLTLYEARIARSGSDPRQRPQNERNVMKPMLDEFLSGAMGFAVDAGFERQPATITGAKWAFPVQRVVQGTAVMSGIYAGRFDEALRRGFVESYTITDSAYSSAAKGERWEFSDWKFEPGTGLWHAGKSRRFVAGKLTTSLTVKSVEPLSPAVFAQVIQPPTADRSDAVRQVKRPASFEDFRELRSARMEGGKLVMDSLAPPATEPVPTLRWVGWGMLGCAAVFGVVVWRRRVSSS